MATAHTPASSSFSLHAFEGWFAKSPIASFLRALAATVLTLAVADWTTAGSISFDKWQSWLIAALAAAVPVLLRALNPKDDSFGMKASSTA